jgi:transcription termination factor Rho
MSVLDRSELEASPLADLHAIADQLGLDGFRRLRKEELIGVILGDSPETETETSVGGSATGGAARKRRAPRLRRGTKVEAESATPTSPASESVSSTEPESSTSSSSSSSSSSSRRGRGTGRSGRGSDQSSEGPDGSPSKAAPNDGASGVRSAEGVVELLGNGSAFLRVDPPEPSDEDVYISAAQVRRCELVSGDRVTGPVRTPRRSERYPSLVRIDTINGASADTVSEGPQYEDLAVAYPSERFALNAGDPTLDAIEWLTPLGRGSRAVIVGPPRAGKTETLRRLLGAVTAAAGAGAEAGTGEVGGSGGMEITVVLVGVRPEELAEWQEGSGRAGIPSPVAALNFAASADAQSQAVERAMDGAKRVAARGGHALVLIDSLDGLHPPAARKTLAAARNLRDGGSLTVIATATSPFGGETTVIALEGGLTESGLPILDLAASGTLKPELLVGEDGARAIAKARAEARG